MSDPALPSQNNPPSAGSTPARAGDWRSIPVQFRLLRVFLKCCPFIILIAAAWAMSVLHTNGTYLENSEFVAGMLGIVFIAGALMVAYFSLAPSVYERLTGISANDSFPRAQPGPCRHPVCEGLKTEQFNWLSEKYDFYAAQLRATNNLTKLRTFEIGPGDGEFSRKLRQLGDFSEAVIVDTNEEFAKQCDTSPSLVTLRTDISSKDFDVSTFPHGDIIVCSDVIEHLQSSQTALNNMFACLKPGGYLFLTSPNRFCASEWATPILTRLMSGGYIALLSSKTLLLQGQKAGFLVRESQRIGLYVPVLSECMGRPGARLFNFMARKLAGTYLRGLCWNQCYVLQRPEQSSAPQTEPEKPHDL
jgi:SAM-dependent methyltransferase